MEVDQDTKSVKKSSRGQGLCVRGGRLGGIERGCVGWDDKRR